MATPIECDPILWASVHFEEGLTELVQCRKCRYRVSRLHLPDECPQCNKDNRAAASVKD